VDQTSGEIARESNKALGGLFEPFGHAVFRRIWIASLLSNFGMLIGAVGGAWAMTQLTPAADKVALVQTASMAPTMLISLVAGAIADMYDRRRVVLIGLSVALVGAASTAVLSGLGRVTPDMLLGLIFLIGCGMALMGPAWQSSVSEQVPSSILPSAIAMNGISYNIARSFGPALGGLIVAAAGATAAFATNAFTYIPLFVVMFLWRRAQETARLPPERLGRAVQSGFRYVIHSPRIRTILIRTALMGMIGGSLSALMPLIARNLLGGGAPTYGIMLGSFGVGAVLGALQVGWVRQKLSPETAVRIGALVLAAAICVVGVSRSPYLTAPALVAAGAVWTLSVTVYNIGVQLSTPRWVSGRALSAFQTAIAGGIAVGSWGWGALAERDGVDTALLVSSVLMLGTVALGLWLKLPSEDGTNEEAEEMLADPEVNMAITNRSGPIVVQLEYRIDTRQARTFHGLMQELQHTRQRNGAYDWSIARDIADPELWTERFTCPTWLDYLRQRNRPTQAERAVQDQARAMHIGPEPLKVRRMLERPFGSVRWKEEAPDRGVTELLPSQPS
jgi:MFS family permease